MSNNHINKTIIATLAIVLLVGGFLFYRDQNLQDKSDLIKVTSPLPNATVISPLVITGEARGTWYFEATFPVRLEDNAGNVLASHYAQAEGEWMTTDFVPFTSRLEFTVTETTPATLILQKDNPSGLPEHDDEIRIHLTLKP